MRDLKDKTIRGGLARLAAQATTMGIRLGSLMVLARLLDPADFGLVGMVTALTGILSIFRDFGLSTATVQRGEIDDRELSTLFWINLAIGTSLSLGALALAPAIARFYHEPRLYGLTVVLASSFVFNAAGVQHSALMQREMRFTAMAVISVVSLGVSACAAMLLAFGGYGYWALAVMTIVQPLVLTFGSWIATGWIPGRPGSLATLRSLIGFGGTVTLNGIVVYCAYNLEKILLGRYWGADAIGIYGRAYQLVSIPTDNLNGAVGEVAFAALSRVQHNPGLVRNYFLKGYSLVLGLTIPISVVGALFAHEVILVALGPRWIAVAPIFQWLTPTIIIFAIINPFAWLLFALGEVNKSLKVALVLSPVVIVGYLVGLPYGPKGVAIGYSVAMAAWVVPHIAWCVRGTPISFRDVVEAAGRPLLSGVVGAMPVLALKATHYLEVSPLVAILVGVTVFMACYACMLLIVMGQRAFYSGLAASFKTRSLPNEA